MQLKYVGDLPLVSHHGVCFDKSHPDKYLYLQAALELLEALSYGPTEVTRHLYTIEHKEFSNKEIVALLHKYVPNLDEMEQINQDKAHAFVQKLRHNVSQAPALNEQEKETYLNNIEMMQEYYYQYVVNETAYELAVEALANEVKEAHVELLEVPSFRNYGIVLKDLEDYMATMKPPVDVKIEFVQNENKKIHIIAYFQYDKK